SGYYDFQLSNAFYTNYNMYKAVDGSPNPLIIDEIFNQTRYILDYTLGIVMCTQMSDRFNLRMGLGTGYSHYISDKKNYKGVEVDGIDIYENEHNMSRQFSLGIEYKFLNKDKKESNSFLQYKYFSQQKTLGISYDNVFTSYNFNVHASIPFNILNNDFRFNIG